MGSSERIDELRHKIGRAKELPKKRSVLTQLDSAPLIRKLTARTDPDRPEILLPAGMISLQPLLHSTLEWATAEVCRVVEKLGSDEISIFADYTGMLVAHDIPIRYRLVGPVVIPTHLDWRWSGHVPCPSLNVRRVKDAALECYTIGHHSSQEAFTMARRYIQEQANTLVIVASPRSARSIVHPDIVLIDTLHRTTRRVRHAT